MHIRCTLLATAALLLCSTAQARVVAADANGFLLQNTVEVKAPRTLAWQALVGRIDHWWPADHTWFGSAGNLSLSARAGGCFCEIDDDRQVEHMRIVHADPGRLLRMQGGLGPLQGMGWQGALDWIFEELPQGSRITLRYQAGGYSPQDITAFVEVIDKVQAQQLGALASYLASDLTTDMNPAQPAHPPVRRKRRGGPVTAD